MSSDDPVFGWQGKANSNDYFGEYNQLLFMIRQVLSKVNVAALCEVIAVHGGGLGPVGFVDLQPLVNQVDGYGNAIPQGVLHNIPYMRMQGGVNAIILDPQVGDIGVTVFADRDITAVKSTAKRANPNSNRRFDVADGLYLGGMLNGIPSQYIQFLSNKIQITSPTEIDLNAPLVTVTAPEIDLSSWAGITVAWPTNATIPAGWLQCPTAQTLVSISSYPRLIVLGTSWGGDGINTVGLPYFAAGYVPVQGIVAALTHGVVIDHTHPIGISSISNGLLNGSPITYMQPAGSTNTASPNSPQGGPDNLAAGRGTRFIVKY